MSMALAAGPFPRVASPSTLISNTGGVQQIPPRSCHVATTGALAGVPLAAPARCLEPSPQAAAAFLPRSFTTSSPQLRSQPRPPAPTVPPSVGLGPATFAAPGPFLGTRRGDLQVASGAVANDGQRWWEKTEGGNMKDLHSTQEFVEALASGGDRLVIVEFFATWCGSCRALFPKLCKIADQHPEILFYKVNFDENKPMCKVLNIKVLPYFHFYRGSEGRLDAFSASISKLQRLREAIATHSTERCSLGPVLGEQELQRSLSGATAAEASSAGAP